MIVHLIEPELNWRLESAPLKRTWMDESANHYAYRCTPLTAANTLGWVIRCPVSFTATWDGLPNPGSIRFDYDRMKSGERPESGLLAYSHRITNHAGQGLIAFGHPYYFCTRPGSLLWISGPANYMKHGVAPCTALVETDWYPERWSINWMMTAPGCVRFEKGEPLAQIMLFPAQALWAEPAQITEWTPLVRARFDTWTAEREQFLRARKGNEWQKKYFELATRTRQMKRFEVERTGSL